MCVKGAVEMMRVCGNAFRRSKKNTDMQATVDAVTNSNVGKSPSSQNTSQ